jgi:hypothetical protein
MKWYISGIILLIVVFLLIIFKKMNPKTDNLNLSKFDSPDLPGSNEKMSRKFLGIINSVFGEFKKQTGIDLKDRVTSGYRTPEHNANVGGSTRSSHTKGYAVDIRTLGLINQHRQLLAKLFLKNGVKRYGVANTFMHFDIGDQFEPKLYAANAVWTYGNQLPFNPLTLA